MTFKGTWEHTLDDKGRVALPAKYRQEFVQGIVLVLANDGCIEVYAPAGHQEMSDLIAAEPPNTPRGKFLRRQFDANSWDAEMDRQGRIPIPKPLREAAGINGAVMIRGCREYLEIWDPQRHEQVMQTQKQAYAHQTPSRGQEPG